MAQNKRKRSRMACEPCRERKRKCNEEMPCSTCSNWGYECYYQDPLRLRSAPSAQIADTLRRRPDTTLGQRAGAAERVSSNSRAYTETLEANSGAAFVRKIGLKVDAANAPRLGLFGWNVGARQLVSRAGAVTALPIVDIVSLADIKSLAAVYFAKVDPCYGFIDSDAFWTRLEARWRSPLVDNTYDGVLAGVAALGALFSHRSINITEVHLVELARSLLDTYADGGAPSFEVLTTWTLRVIYMRMTALPHPTWIASSTLMHLIEASHLHHESSQQTILSGTTPCDPNMRRRLVGVAQHLNLWISYDLGLSRVSFSSSSQALPGSRAGDFTIELLNLLPISVSLGPENTYHVKDLEELLFQTLSGSHTEPPSILGQCNLVLCLLRRLCVINSRVSPEILEQVLELFKRSLRAAQSMVSSCCPWHHVANVPFHMVSVLLDMDTSPGLKMLPEAMQTLNFVARNYETETMREAYSTACLLIALYQRRKQEDAKLLSGVLEKLRQSDPEPSLQTTIPTSNDISWLEDLVADVPRLQGVDLSQFWQEDLAGLPLGLGMWEK